jgi:hypothetical protein
LRKLEHQNRDQIVEASLKKIDSIDEKAKELKKKKSWIKDE